MQSLLQNDITWPVIWSVDMNLLSENKQL